MMNGSASREKPLAGGALQRLGGALMLPARRHSTVRARRNTLRLCACVLLSLFVLYHNRFLFFSNGSMGNRHDWYTLARQRHTLRVLGATLMDSDAARLRSDFGASAAPPEGSFDEPGDVVEAERLALDEHGLALVKHTDS